MPVRLVISPRWVQWEQQESPTRKKYCSTEKQYFGYFVEISMIFFPTSPAPLSWDITTEANTLRFMLSVKRDFTAERWKYDKFKEILAKFSDGRSAAVIDLYLLA
jgi:hypothetical protein